MQLDVILQDAVISIESLKDYYFSQIDKISKEIDKKIGRYIPGAVLERYLYAKATGQEESLNDELGLKVKELADKVIYDVTVNKNESGYSISYKMIDDFVNNPKFETNPQKASREFTKLTERIEILNNSILISLLIKYETTIATIFKYIISKYPNAYLEKKTLSYSEIIELNSEVDSVKEILVEREIEEIMRMPISDWYKLLKEKHKLNFNSLDDYFSEFREIYYRRNIIVHNNGVVNRQYISGCENKQKKELKVGMQLSVNKEYLTNAFKLTYIMIYGTIYSLCNISENSYAIHEELHSYAFQHMIDKEWEISHYIYKNLKSLKTSMTQTIDIEIRKINYWISVKNLYGIDEIYDEVKNYDVSAMEGEFKVAKACLLDEYKEINSLLEKYLNKNVYPQSIESWPLFLQYRKSSEYKKFRKSHLSDFEKQLYEPEEIKREDLSEEILEKSESLPII